MRIALVLLIMLTLCGQAASQVDTAFIYNENTPYGTLDLRLRKSSSNYFYLQEGETFSFRTEGGERTDTYLHMTAWDSNPYQQGQLREKFSTSDRFVMNYRLLLPENVKSDTKYPIVFFLHGLQESANCVDEECIHATRDYDPNENVPEAPLDADFPLYNNDYNLLHGGRNYLNARNRAGGKTVGDASLDSRAFPGFVLFPQSNNGWSPSEVESALKILRLVMKKYNIDPNRVYVNGLSKGGYGAFEAMKRAPWLFAAGALFSPISDASINVQNLGSSVQHIPLWIFQGGQDLAPLPKETEERIRRLRTSGMFIRYTLYPHLGHATWNEAMDEPDFFTWLLGYSNTKIHSFGGSEAICQSDSEGLTLTLPPGYAEYEWQLNEKTVKIGKENFLSTDQSGAYRARYKFSNTGLWNAWSKEISIGFTQPESASFIQHGTLHLPDLNGKNEAVVEAVGDYNHYRWYRYETLIDFAGDSDDTLKIATIPSGLGSGFFSVRVANYGGCYSDPSVEKKIFFNNKSPVNITAPGNVTAQSTTASEIELSWKDNSDDESGFEIWRRPITSGSSSPWVMPIITAADAEKFTDKGLKPATKYEYKIRAVSDLGRSEYSPGSALYAETPPDENPPAAPPNVTGELSDVNTIRVQWNSAVDNSSITGYRLFVNDQEISIARPDTIYYLRDLKTNADYTIQVAAIDAGNNMGKKSVPVTVSTAMTGLFYKHSTGAWNDLASIDFTKYEYEGRIPYFDLSPKRQEDFFNFRFDGFLLISKAGRYEFRVGSNDGSRLRLNDTLLVNNDGIHEMKTITSEPRSLSKGPQRITVDFFDHMESDSLVVEYNGPDTNNEWVPIGRDVLKSSSDAGAGKIDFSLYPNPASDGSTTVALRGASGDPFSVTIVDAMGRIVREYVINEIGRSSVVLSGLDVKSGFYIVTVRQNNALSSKRLILVR
jgi:hypothetical protein